MEGWNVSVGVFKNKSYHTKNFTYTQFLAVKNPDYEVPRYRDPAMIGILVAMIFMFITICVVLRLFSRCNLKTCK